MKPNICAAATTGPICLQKLSLVLFPSESRAGMDGAPPLPRARDGVRRRRSAQDAGSARLRGLPDQPGRARTRNSGNYRVALKRFRLARSSGGQSWCTACKHSAAQTRAASPRCRRTGRRGWLRLLVASVELARSPQMVAFVAGRRSRDAQVGGSWRRIRQMARERAPISDSCATNPARQTSCAVPTASSARLTPKPFSRGRLAAPRASFPAAMKKRGAAGRHRQTRRRETLPQPEL